MCEKHGLEYRVRGIFESCVDIVDKLGEVGEKYVIWRKERKLAKKKLA